MTNAWVDLLTAEQIEADFVLTASLDPRTAECSRKFWESRTVAQLNAMKAGAWTANQPDTYQKARSYLALRVNQ